MKAISDVKFNAALQRIKDETVVAGYVGDIYTIRDESNLQELLADLLNEMDCGKVSVIRLEDHGLLFGKSSRYAVARIYKDYTEKKTGTTTYSEMFASVVIEANGAIYSITGEHVRDRATGNWIGWQFTNVRDGKIPTGYEPVPTGFIQKTIVVRDEATLQAELAYYVAGTMHDEVIENGGTERVVLIEDESTMLFAGGRFAIATIYASQYDDPVSQFAYYAAIDLVARGKKYSMTHRFYHDAGKGSFVMEYGELTCDDACKSDDGAWIYKKLNDGTFEAWRHYAENGTRDATGSVLFPEKNIYYCFFDLPFAAVEPPHIFVSIRNDNDEMLHGVTPSVGANQQFTVLSARSDATRKINADIHVIGKWK